MTRIKKQVLSKLKEYANKMGRDHLGGDDIPGNKKKGGLRDFDGYDNVDYNKDMPMDEVSSSDASPELKKVAKSMSDNDVKDFASTSHKGLPKKVKQEIVKKLKELNESVKQSDYISGLKDLQKAVKSEKGSFQGNNGGNVAKLYYEKALKMGMDNKFIDNLTRKRINSYNKKAFSLSGGSLHTAVVGGIDLLLKNINEYANKMGRDHLGGDSIPSAKRGGLRDNDGYDNVQYNRDMPQDESVVSEEQDCWDTHKVGNPKTKISSKTGKRVNNCVPKNEDITDQAFLKAKRVKEQGVGTATVFLKNKEELDESFPNMKQWWKEDKKEIMTFIYFLQRQLPPSSKDKYEKSWKDIVVQLQKRTPAPKSIYTKLLDESVVNESTLLGEFLQEGGLPQNWMAGRVSDYHTKLRGKKRNYDDTNFTKLNTGQPDIPDEELDEENANGKFDTVLHLKLLTKAMKAMPGSKNQKDIIRQLNVIRISGGMKPLKETAIEEYASRLSNSYILDDESILKGTPEPKDAIDIDEEAKRDYKAEYKKFQSSTKSKKYRAELNKYNRDKGTYGNGDGKDASHKGGKIVGFEAESTNRGRAEKSRLKKK
jgi:hypothetical protein